MTKEDKELLIKDLCARLPYGVIVAYKSRESEGHIKLGYGNIGYVSEIGRGWWVYCKPYLRPMPSMTEEEVDEYVNTFQYDDYTESLSKTIESFDWLNEHHFDFRNLIERGLAIDCTSLNVY